jgi:AsmA protein
MEKRGRSILMIVGGILALIILVILCVPLFLNADSFRSKIEATLSSSLGRKVTLGKLDLSVWSGSLVAQNATVADDPRFSAQPFMQTAVVKINVEVLPLIFGQQVHITGFELDAPKISLLRAADGTWNYSSIGSAAKTGANKDTSSMLPNLTVGHVVVSNGELTIGTVGAGAGTKRTYDKLTIDAKDFSFAKAFPFTVSVHLPGDGTVSMKGSAGPVNEKDASLTPFAANVEMKHIDPLAAGFVDASAGVTGVVGGINVDAAWNGQQLHVTKLLVDSPTLTIVRSNAPAAPTTTTPSNNNMLSTLSADLIQVKNGAITVATKGQQGAPAVYQQLNAEVKNFSPKSASPFTLSAVLPGGGALDASGSAGPLNQQDAAATPLDVHATLRHANLATSGVVSPDAGIGGVATIDMRAISNGQTLNANVAAHVDGLQVAKNGSPSAKPVDVKATVTQNMRALTGDVQQAAITIGRAVINISGTYQTSGPTTALNLKVVGQGVPIDEIEAFLPSVGVKLPSGSRLQGGTLTTTLNVTGSSANPIISGPLRLDNTNLAGFDLGAKMQSVTALMGGGGRTGSGTQIQSLSTNIRVAGGAVRTDNLSIVVPAFGSATGAGSVSATGGLDYQMILKVTALGGGGGGAAASSAGGVAGQLMGMIPGGAAGGAIGGVAGAALKNGIPVAIGGTTSNPTFTPNMSALAKGGASSAAQGLLNGQTGQGKKGSQTDSLTNALGGLLGKH